MSVNTITVTGNLTTDPEIRRTANDVPYCKLRVAVNRRVLNADTDKWEDRTDGFFNVTAWRDLAEHIRRTLRKGDRVTVTGRMMRRQYEAVVGEGQTETRHVHEIDADDVGASMRWQSWARLEVRTVDPDGTREEGARGTTEDEEDPVTDDSVAPAA